MLNLAEYRTRDVGLADRLVYAALVDDGVMLCKDGALLAGWYFRGPDVASSTAAELAAISARINGALLLGSGWMVHVDAIRREAPGYPAQGAFPDRTTRVIDDERRVQFEANGVHYESLYALVLTYLPPSRAEGRVVRMMFSGQEGGSASETPGGADRYLRLFQDQVRDLEDQLGAVLAMERMRASPVTDRFGRTVVRDSLLQYLHFCASGDNHPINLPSPAMYLDSILGNTDFRGGIEPRLGARHLRVVAIDGYPQECYPGLLAGLDELELEYRWSTRFVFLDPVEARSLLNAQRRKWSQKVRGWKDQVFQTANGPVNLDAAEMTGDVDQALAEAASGLVRFGFMSVNVVLLHENATVIDDLVREVTKRIRNLGFAARVESVNAVEAWLGTLPGHGVENLRRPLLHTLNLADLMPATAVWPGKANHPCPFYPPGSPPLAYAATSGHTPFRLNTHVSDVGHMLCLGPTGAGKTTLLAFLVAQQWRFPGAQVFAFDYKYGLFPLASAAGGDHYDIGRDSSLHFCPLADLESPGSVPWATDWIEILCDLQGLVLSPQQRARVYQAIELLKTSPARTLTEFVANVQDAGIRAALEHYTISGPMGSLLDAEHDTLRDSRFMCFEMEELMSMGPKTVVPVLLYLFRRIEKRLDGSPTIIPIDESWKSLENKLFQSRLRDWFKVLRSKNAAVHLYTQSPSDVNNSAIRDVILESCPTKILLPNPEAKHASGGELYRVMGLNERQIELIANAVPKRHYYYVSPEGRRLFQLGLGGVALSFLGVSGADDISKIKALVAEHGERWPAVWLEIRGYADWAKYWLSLTN